MYQKRPDRFREPMLEYVRFALGNFGPGEMDSAGMQTAQLLPLLAREQGHPLAGVSLSMIAMSQSPALNVINIQEIPRTEGHQGQVAEASGPDVEDTDVLGAEQGVASRAKESMGACPACTSPITAENQSLSCRECGKRFCQICEGWMEKTSEHKGRKVPTVYPLCEICYPEELAEKRRAIEEQIRAEEVDLTRREEGRRAQEEAERKAEEARKKAGEERARQDRLDRERQKKEDAQRLEEGLWLAGITTIENAAEKQKASARRFNVPIEIKNSIGMKLRLIPAGEFLMGGDSEGPIHKVKFTKPFYIGIYQVTQREWKAVMGENPSEFKGDELPVERVSWGDCQKFIASLNRKERTLRYRLPTEAEWEYACRGGSTTKYCFGDDRKHLGEYAWYEHNSGVEEYRTVKVGLIFKKSVKEKTIEEQKTQNVGQKKPNYLGLYDMHGNVWEWCEDWYGGNYYKNSPENEPKGSSSGSDRVYRGGSWASKASDCASDIRARNVPRYISASLGFRIVRSL